MRFFFISTKHFLKTLRAATRYKSVLLRSNVQTYEVERDDLISMAFVTTCEGTVKAESTATKNLNWIYVYIKRGIVEKLTSRDLIAEFHSASTTVAM